MNDSIRAAILAFVQSIFPVLQMTGVVNFDGAEVASIMLVISNLLTLLAFLVKNGQQASGSSSALTVSATAAPVAETPPAKPAKK